MVVTLEEVSLCLKSKIRWLELGDQNTTFFHRSINSCMSHNPLLSIIDSDDSHLNSHYGVVQVEVNFYCNSFDSQVILYRELSSMYSG